MQRSEAVFQGDGQNFENQFANILHETNKGFTKASTRHVKNCADNQTSAYGLSNIEFEYLDYECNMNCQKVSDSHFLRILPDFSMNRLDRKSIPSYLLWFLYAALRHISHESFCPPNTLPESVQDHETLKMDIEALFDGNDDPGYLNEWCKHCANAGIRLDVLPMDQWSDAASISSSLLALKPSVILKCRETKKGNVRTVYHGSPLHRWHNIIHQGLDERVSAVPPAQLLFGSGVYLSSKVEVALNFAPFGETIINGVKARCIAICEVDIGDGSGDTSIEVADEYILAKRGDLVNISHLVLWFDGDGDGNANGSSRLKSPTESISLFTMTWYTIVITAIIWFAVYK